MKKILLFVFLLNLIGFNNFSQTAPKLTLEGSNVSLKKGTIDVETLSAIIQDKQEEVHQRIFRNLVVSHFWDNGDSTLNNFTIQFFVYNLMIDAIEGKNKKAITKNMVATAAEFSEVYSFMLYTLISKGKTNPVLVAFEKNLEGYKKNSKEIYIYKTSSTESNKLLLSLKPVIKISDDNTDDFRRTVNVNFSIVKKATPYFNILLDFCFKELLKSSETFNKYKDNEEFQRWFDANSYSKNNVLIKKINMDSTIIQDFVKNEYKEFQKIKKSYDTIKVDLDNIIKNPRILANLPDSTINKLDEFVKSILPKTQNTNDRIKKIENIKKIYDDSKSFLELIPLLEPIVRKRASEIDEISQRQYDAIKTILKDFAGHIKGNSKHDVFNQLTNTFIDNFQYEVDSTSQKGIAYVDIESFISQIYSDFADKLSSRTKTLIKPIFEIGTNALFAYNNDNKTFGLNDIKRSYFKNPNNLMIASEKIGAKFMLINTKNQRGYKPGEVHLGRFGKDNYQVWMKPPKEPTIDDISITGYVSGILYNLASIKSAKEFNQPFWGVGLSCRFFNGLSVSLNYAKTLKPANISTDTNKIFKQDFVGVNLDIPLIEYITAIRKKNK
jgi:hypothetical protein